MSRQDPERLPGRIQKGSRKVLSLVDGRALVRSRRYVCEIRDYNPIHVQPGVTRLCDMWHGRLCPSVRRFGRTSGRMLTYRPRSATRWSTCSRPLRASLSPPARAHRVGGPVVAQRRRWRGDAVLTDDNHRCCCMFSTCLFQLPCSVSVIFIPQSVYHCARTVRVWTWLWTGSRARSANSSR